MRIKCDQQFPTCNQCTKRRRTCDLSATGFRAYAPVVEAPTGLEQVGIVPSPTLAESVNDERGPPQGNHSPSDCVEETSGLAAYSSVQEELADVRVRHFQTTPFGITTGTGITRCTSQNMLHSQHNPKNAGQSSNMQRMLSHHVGENHPALQNSQHNNTTPMDFSTEENAYEHSLAASSNFSPGCGAIPVSNVTVGRAASSPPRADSIESSKERSFLLRHFSSTPGRWLV